MNFKKLLITSILTVSMAFASVAFANDASDVVIKLTIGNPEMTVNGVVAEIDPGRSTAPVICEERTLVPIRSIIEAMGGTVEWVGEESKVILKLNEDEINLVIDSTCAFFNGVESTLDVAPVIINERTMLPIRYIAESFKFDVDWDGETSTVTVAKTSAADNAEAAENNENEVSIDTTLTDEDISEGNLFEDDLFLDDFFEDDLFEDEFLE